MDPGAETAVTPNKTTAETNNNGFIMAASSAANAISKHLAAE
jgi:hypothetical protein